MTDDELTLYYYDDGLGRAERQAIADALATDPALAERYRRLSAELDTLPDPAAPAPGAAALARWRNALDRVAGPEPVDRRQRTLGRWSFAFGVAVTAALAIGIGIGLMLGGVEAPVRGDGAATVDVAVFAETPSPVFVRGLRAHLRESRTELAALPGDSAGERMLRINELLDRNRRYERAAELNDAARLARVLRAFERVLQELALRDLTAAEADALRAELLFRLDVVLTKLNDRPSDAEQTI